MPTCIEYMRKQLVDNQQEYVIKHQAKNDLIVQRIGYAHQSETVWVFHAEAPLEPEDIRRCFDFKGYLLFIVDEKLIPDDVADKTQTPKWLRVLHGLFLGRVYVWNGRGVYGVHFDWDTGDVSESPFIPVEDLRCQESGSWVKGWPGVYRLAFLGDRAWWTESPPRREYTYNANGGKRSYNTAHDQADATGKAWSYQEQARKRQDKFNEDFGVPPIKRTPPPKPADYFNQFMACRTLAEAKALWKRLLVEHHPDKLGADPTQDAIDRATRITQEINQAYQKAEKVL